MNLVDLPPASNSSMVEAEKRAELERRLTQDVLLTTALGPLLPRAFRPARRRAVLDLACGPGGWALEVARRYPQLQVVGLDLNPTAVAYARSLAHAQALENAAFVVMDVTQPLDFPEASFALVNGRLLMRCLTRAAWPSLIGECWRVTRPGGLIHLTECERLISTSPTLEALTALATLAFKLAGQSFSPDGRTLGVTSVLGRFLRGAGCEHLHQRASVLDFSAGMPLYEPVTHNLSADWFRLKPFLLKMQVVTSERFEELYRQIQRELLADDFCALWYFLSV